MKKHEPLFTCNLIHRHLVCQDPNETGDMYYLQIPPPPPLRVCNYFDFTQIFTSVNFFFYDSFLSQDYNIWMGRNVSLACQCWCP